MGVQGVKTRVLSREATGVQAAHMNNMHSTQTCSFQTVSGGLTSLQFCFLSLLNYASLDEAVSEKVTMHSSVSSLSVFT